MASMGNSSIQASLAEEVNKRMANAAKDLEAKYAAGNASVEQSCDGPTGNAYKEKAAKDAKQRQSNRERREAQAEEINQIEKENRLQAAIDNDEDDDGDEELKKLREARLKELKKQRNETLENLGKGHGSYREIVQDQFLTEVTSSYRVVCHFYHRDFQRCTIIDHHLQKLAQRHVETKFIKINAEKAPFFVEKLIIRTMPTVVIFFDGVAADKIVGFEGLADQMPEGKEDEFPTIVVARLLGSKNAINKEAIVDDEGIEAAMKAKMDQMRKQGYTGLLASNLLSVEDEDDDFSLDD